MTANSNVLRLPVLQVMTGLTCVTFITETNRPVLPSYFIKTYSILFIIQEFYINDIKVILNEILKARYHSAHFRSSIIFRKGDTICNLEHILIFEFNSVILLKWINSTLLLHIPRSNYIKISLVGIYEVLIENESWSRYKWKDKWPSPPYHMTVVAKNVALTEK